jgi:hypothetical protein
MPSKWQPLEGNMNRPPITRLPQLMALCAFMLLAQPCAQAQQRVRIVALGDSYSSGEGTPDRDRTDNAPAQWSASGKNLDDSRMARSNLYCHRSNNAWPRQLADAFEQRSGRGVEFISFACSGAKIPDVIDREQADDDGARSLVGVAGDCATPGGGDPLLGQLCEVERHFTQGPAAGASIDALVFTLGGNDVGFAPAVMTCMSPTNCADPVVHTPFGDKALPTWKGFENDIEAGKTELRKRFTRLGSRIEQINARYLARFGRLLIGSVFAVEYPAAFRNERGQLCGLPELDLQSILAARLPPEPDPLDLMTTAELRWGENKVLPALNGTVSECIARLGRDCDPAAAALAPQDGGYGFFAGGTSAAFRTHGFCATQGERWTVKILESIARQGNTSGSVHPNARGHQALRDAVLPQLDRLLPPSPLQIAVDGAIGWTTAGFRFEWRGIDPRAKFLQVAQRGAGSHNGRAGLDRPTEYPPAALATPPRFPSVLPGNDWRIASAPARTPWTTARPTEAVDVAARACTEAACSPWSAPLRVVQVNGFEVLPRLQQLAITVAGRGTDRITLRVGWEAAPPRPNAFVELRSAAAGQAATTREVEAGNPGYLFQLPANNYSLSARHCVSSLATASARAGRRCGAWSDTVTVNGKSDIARDSGLERPQRPATPLNPDDLRPHNLPR